MAAGGVLGWLVAAGPPLAWLPGVLLWLMAAVELMGLWAAAAEVAVVVGATGPVLLGPPGLGGVVLPAVKLTVAGWCVVESVTGVGLLGLVVLTVGGWGTVGPPGDSVAAGMVWLDVVDEETTGGAGVPEDAGRGENREHGGNKLGGS